MEKKKKEKKKGKIDAVVFMVNFSPYLLPILGDYGEETMGQIFLRWYWASD